MSVLRKACRNCTSSKRKCVVQLPKCVRCAQKGLACTYDLEPLGAPTGHPEESARFTYNPSNCDSPGYCVMKTIKYRANGDLDPAICKPGHEDAFEVIRMGYHPIPDLIKAGKSAVFIHPKLQLNSSNYNPLAVFQKTGKAGVTYENFQRLIQFDIKTAHVEEALTALQALIIYLSAFLFPSGTLEEPNVEQFLHNVTIIVEWTQALMTSVQTRRRSRGQSPWQEWLFGESARRTIIMSYALTLAVFSFTYGYCSNWLFLESLPFDRRPGLWMAESPQAWIAAARARTGEEVKEELSSFHEFAESVEGSDQSFCGDRFLGLVVVIHNGDDRQIKALG